MTAATSINSPEARVLSAAGIADTPNLNISEARVMSVANIPADTVKSSEARVIAVGEQPSVIEIPQARVLAVVRGHIPDPSVRAWTFTLDGHDYYVLHLGEVETLVYDTHSQMWYNWGSDNLQYWRALDGCPWLDASAMASDYGSPIVVGDYTYGSLYFLNSDIDTDDDPVLGNSTQHTFERIAYGQIPIKGYNSHRCFAVELLGSIGDLTDDTLTGIKLEYSDDRGATYQDAGTVNISNGDINARVDWRSLGSMSAPGRLFRITDSGALRRIDSLDMADDQGEI